LQYKQQSGPRVGLDCLMLLAFAINTMSVQYSLSYTMSVQQKHYLQAWLVARLLALSCMWHCVCLVYISYFASARMLSRGHRGVSLNQLSRVVWQLRLSSSHQGPLREHASWSLLFASFVVPSLARLCGYG
jgi:hypothetical protein